MTGNRGKLEELIASVGRSDLPKGAALAEALRAILDDPAVYEE